MKVVVVCFGFEFSNLNKQPWRYIHELLKHLPSEGFELIVVSDVDCTDTAGIPVKPVDNILNYKGPTPEVLASIRQENPDIVISLVGQSTFIRNTTIASVIEKPAIGIVGGPFYSLSEVLNVGVTELYRNRQHLSAHFIGSLIPDRLVRKRASAYDVLITLTNESETRLQDVGVSSATSTIPPGIDDFDLELPNSQNIKRVRQDLNPKDVPTILYFTSPLTLRGTDTLLKAFARVRKKHPCRLMILSRQDSGGLTEEENYLRKLALQRSVADSFEVIPRDLSPEGVKTHLAAADIVALPFKIVIASVPISILEAMSVGKPTITTKIAGIPEIIDERQLVRPADVSSLAMTLESFVTDEDLRATAGSQNRERMQHYQRWDDARAQFLDVLEECA